MEIMVSLWFLVCILVFTQVTVDGGVLTAGQGQLPAAVAHPATTDHRSARGGDSEENGVKIASGSEATLGQFPWQTYIVVDHTQLCSGALVAPSWVLTSAKCTHSHSHFILYFGSLHPDSHTVEQTISRDKFVHPSYQPDSLIDAYDIALIKLARNINYTESISAITIEGSADTFVGRAVRTAGWGNQTTDLMLKSDASPVLKWTEMGVISNTQCGETYGSGITSNHVCTSGANNTGVCQGDDGGALVLQQGNGQWRLIGVVTATESGRGCDTGLPSIFSRGSSHQAWIEQLTGIDVVVTPSRADRHAAGSSWVLAVSLVVAAATGSG